MYQRAFDRRGFVQQRSGPHMKTARGVKLFRFDGLSMFPFLRPADRLVVKTGPNLALAVGTVVVMDTTGTIGPGGVVAHRIVRTTAQDRFVTKGDNLRQPDPRLLCAGDIVGVVAMVLRRGRLMSLTGAWPRRRARAIAALSRWNLTPALLASSFKQRVQG